MMRSILKLQALPTITAVSGFDGLPFMSSTSAVCSGVSVQCPSDGTQVNLAIQ
jgi:hypothetical protein